ncbi:7475_t:CDS:2 [Diversispora eburnea]|uniref:7475_t:CDS:1 n=1 Tax=Diversispora eburnea TaxID=1213867 RepID=A0A9N9G009_9GLOM|nr:7475_t:CDS:2 [Diversispora eburnea]
MKQKSKVALANERSKASITRVLELNIIFKARQLKVEIVYPDCSSWHLTK